MAVAGLLKSSGLTALVAALAITSLPADAMAQGFRGAREAAQQQQRSEPQAQRQSSGGDRASWRQSAPQRSQQAQPVTRQDGGQRNWQNRGNGNPGWQGGNQAQRVERSGSSQNQAQRDWQNRRDGNRQNVDRNGSGPGFRGAYEAGSNRSWQDRRNDGDRNWRDGNQNRRDRDARNDRRWNNDNNGWNNNNGRWDNGRRDNDRRWSNNNNNRWNNDWRRDRRYDWSSYRNSNRNVYRLGRYYAPYRNYYYRPISSGFYLDTLFFGNRYWINDPWQYRLPPAYGSYRWIRYYDDVLLVDTYSGEVVDVIRDFFW